MSDQIITNCIREHIWKSVINYKKDEYENEFEDVRVPPLKMHINISKEKNDLEMKKAALQTLKNEHQHTLKLIKSNKINKHQTLIDLQRNTKKFERKMMASIVKIQRWFRSLRSRWFFKNLLQNDLVRKKHQLNQQLVETNTFIAKLQQEQKQRIVDYEEKINKMNKQQMFVKQQRERIFRNKRARGVSILSVKLKKISTILYQQKFFEKLLQIQDEGWDNDIRGIKKTKKVNVIKDAILGRIIEQSLKIQPGLQLQVQKQITISSVGTDKEKTDKSSSQSIEKHQALKKQVTKKNFNKAVKNKSRSNSAIGLKKQGTMRKLNLQRKTADLKHILNTEPDQVLPKTDKNSTIRKHSELSANSNSFNNGSFQNRRSSVSRCSTKKKAKHIWGRLGTINIPNVNNTVDAARPGALTAKNRSKSIVFSNKTPVKKPNTHQFGSKQFQNEFSKFEEENDQQILETFGSITDHQNFILKDQVVPLRKLLSMKK